jgi:hypothetical protein
MTPKLKELLDQLADARSKAGNPNYSGQGFEFESLALNNITKLIQACRLMSEALDKIDNRIEGPDSLTDAIEQLGFIEIEAYTAQAQVERVLSEK